MKINYEKLNRFIDIIDWKKVWNDTFSSDCTNLFFYRKDKNYTPLDDVAEHSGASKVVLIDENEDYVLKLPFRYVYDEEVYCSETDSYEEDYIPLQGAPFIDEEGFDNNYDEWNYCQTEADYYKLAKREGLEMLFAQTELLCNEPYPIYAQEKCVNCLAGRAAVVRSKEEITRKTDSLKQSASLEQQDWFFAFNNNWILDVVDKYGENILFKFFNFLTKYSMNDFHSSNYGYSTIDNRPVLIDFSGFND